MVFHVVILVIKGKNYPLNKRTELSNLKTKLGQRFGGTCYFCGCQWSKKGMTIHHIYYLKKDITYDQFPKGIKGSLEYYTKLTPLIKANPKRFRYLCNNCHQAFERFMRFGDIKLNKMLKERKYTIKTRQRYLKKQKL